MEYLLTFGSTHKALKAEKVLKENNIPFKLIPTPKKFTAFCDFSILFEENVKITVENILKNYKVSTVALFKKEGDTYVKM